MEKITLNTNFERNYRNNGEHAEQAFRFTMTGKIIKADSLSHTLGGDYLDIQIKSAKATVCKGTNLKAYLDLDAAKRFAYVTKDFQTAYIMSRAEYEEFVNEFSYVTYDSRKNGGAIKMRLKSESQKMMEWFAAR